MAKRAAAMAGLGFLAACSAGADLPPAQDAVTRFHQMLNAGDSAGIYADSGPDMKKVTSQADLMALLDAVHRKLGAFQSAKLTGWRENATTSGSFVTLSYAAQYDRAQAAETFSWRVEGGHLLLASYFITSNYMMTH